MSQAVLEILDRIRHLPDADRLIVDEQLAQITEAEEARKLAKQKGIDQAAIDQAVDAVRYKHRR